MTHFEPKWWMIWTSWVLCIVVIITIAIAPHVYVEPNELGFYIPEVGGFHFTFEAWSE